MFCEKPLLVDKSLEFRLPHALPGSLVYGAWTWTWFISYIIGEVESLLLICGDLNISFRTVGGHGMAALELSKSMIPLYSSRSLESCVINEESSVQLPVIRR